MPYKKKMETNAQCKKTVLKNRQNELIKLKGFLKEPIMIKDCPKLKKKRCVKSNTYRGVFIENELNDSQAKLPKRTVSEKTPLFYMQVF